MSDMTLEVTPDLKKYIKKALRVTHDSLDDDIEEIILGGLADIQSSVGPISFAGDSISSQKALNLLKTYCFYSWNDMSHEFSKDSERDILSLQMCILQYGR